AGDACGKDRPMVETRPRPTAHAYPVYCTLLALNGQTANFAEFLQKKRWHSRGDRDRLTAWASSCTGQSRSPSAKPGPSFGLMRLRLMELAAQWRRTNWKHGSARRRIHTLKVLSMTQERQQASRPARRESWLLRRRER